MNERQHCTELIYKQKRLAGATDLVVKPLIKPETRVPDLDCSVSTFVFIVEFFHVRCFEHTCLLKKIRNINISALRYENAI